MKQRQRDLIDLLNRKNDYTTVKDLSKELGVSERTVHYDLESISTKDKRLEIKRKRGVGVRIIWSEDILISENEGPLTPRQLDIFKKLLFDEITMTVTSFSEIYFTSPSSIVNDLDVLKLIFLNESTLRLSADSHGTKLVGTEKERQKTMLLFNESIFRTITYSDNLVVYAELLYPYYSKEIVDQCEMMIRELESYNLYSVSKHYEINIFNVLVVMVHRMQQDKHVKIDGEMLVLDEVLAMKHYLIASDLLEILSNSLPFTYTDDDMYTLSIYLQANRLEFSPSRTFDDSVFSEVTRSTISRMSITLNVDLNHDEALYQSVMVHMYHLVYRMKNQIKIINPLLEEIKKHFRLLYDLTWLIFDGEKDQLGITLTEDEIGFLMLHFQTALDRKEKSKRVLVVCPKGVVSSEFIVNRIQRILPPLDVIELASLDMVDKYDLSDINLIISTIPVKEVDKEVVIVSPLVSEQDLVIVSRGYQLSLQRTEQIDTDDFSVLSEYIDLDYIYLNEELETQEQIIKKVSNDLKIARIVQEGYEESIFERETMGGTHLDTGAAVPHGSFNLVNETKIPVVISNKPIKWNGADVYLIVFFVIAKDNLQNSKKILKDVFKLVNSTQLITKKIIKMTPEELFHYIKEESI